MVEALERAFGLAVTVAERPLLAAALARPCLAKKSEPERAQPAQRGKDREVTARPEAGGSHLISDWPGCGAIAATCRPPAS